MCEKFRKSIHTTPTAYNEKTFVSSSSSSEEISLYTEWKDSGEQIYMTFTNLKKLNENIDNHE